jgi:hypothetical protein
MLNVNTNKNSVKKDYICTFLKNLNPKKMKRILFSIVSLSLLSQFSFAQCNELFISEYVEGTSNNKAIEIYNPTQNSVSLANYRLVRWDNGNVHVEPFPLEAVLNLPTNITMPPNTTYVIALNLTDPAGTGQSAPIDVALQAAADTLMCPGCATGTNQPRVLCFNGDDAISLQKNNGVSWINVDIFGCIGEQPSNSTGTFSPTAGWTILPPYSSMPATYDSNTQGPYFLQYWSQDKTLKRKFAVKQGVTVNPAPQSFNASTQWDSLPANTFSGLGSHSCECYPQAIKSNELFEATTISPNPTNGIFTLNTIQFTGQIQITNVAGQIVKSIEITRLTNNISIDLTGFPKGMYQVSLIGKQTGKSEQIAHKKLIIQ